MEAPRKEVVALMDAKSDPSLWGFGLSMFVDNYEHRAPPVRVYIYTYICFL